MFATLFVDAFPELFQIFELYIPWYMMKNYEVYHEDYLLSETSPTPPPHHSMLHV
jgi:hypothetical protein